MSENALSKAFEERLNKEGVNLGGIRAARPRRDAVPHWDVSPARGPLFDTDVPNGFHYRNDFVTSVDEALLAESIARVEFSTFEMRGVVARRRVAFFGRSYDTGATITAALPEFLMPLRAMVAAWANVDPDAFALALINEYSITFRTVRS